jgi:DNA adenine methylase
MQMIPYGIEDWREPFFGGGSVTIAFLQSPQGQQCKRFVVGDLYKEVYYFWKGVQGNPTELLQLSGGWFIGSLPNLMKLKDMDENSQEYKELYDQVFSEEGEVKQLWKWVQGVDVESLTDIQRGARFLLSSKMSFSGVADSGGMSKERVLEFDIDKTGASIRETSELLQKVEIYNQSFEQTMADVDKDKSFIFLDPPYITQEVGHLYGKNGSTHNGFPHEGLANLCMNTPCKWLMTIDDCVKARRLYRGAIIERFYIPYTMTSLVGRDNRLNGEELIISNYDTHGAAMRVGSTSNEPAEDLASKYGF